MALLSLLIFWMGCLPASRAFDTSLVILDAHEAPPAFGFALLVDDVSFSQNGTPLCWNVISDTLHWSPNTGEVSISVGSMSSRHWLICSPDPITPGRMRTSVVPVGLRDTCRLDVQVPYQVLLRLRRKAPFEPNWQIVLQRSSKQELVLHEVNHPGGYNFQGQVVSQQFPLQLKLRQANDANAKWTTLDSATVPFQGEQTAVVAAWSNFAPADL